MLTGIVWKEYARDYNSAMTLILEGANLVVCTTTDALFALRTRKKILVDVSYLEN